MPDEVHDESVHVHVEPELAEHVNRDNTEWVLTAESRITSLEHRITEAETYILSQSGISQTLEASQRTISLLTSRVDALEAQPIPVPVMPTVTEIPVPDEPEHEKQKPRKRFNLFQ